MTTAISRSAIGIAPREVKALSELAILRGYAAIAFQWLVIAAAIAAAEVTHSWLVAIAAIVVVATRQHALAVLMHDASHTLLSRNKRLNDVISSLLLSFPILTSTTRYRSHHMRHHQYVNTEQDPDLENAQTNLGRAALVRQLVADILGLNTLTTLTTLSHFGIIGPLFKSADAPGGLPAFEKRLAIAYYLGVAVVVTATSTWGSFLLYWVLPLTTVLSPILRFRALAEHGACANSHDLDMARSVYAGIAERFLLAPCNVNYHLEHHLYPSVPFYNLPRLSGLLRSHAIFTDHAHRNDGYFLGDPSVFDEVTATAEASVRQAATTGGKPSA